jgi:GT2 family glycosyltransferase
MLILTARNLAIIILSFCSASATSARTMTFIALGPVGISIMTNHNMGFSGSHDVFAAMTYTKAILILLTIS